MKIDFTIHAKKQLKERNISKETVQKTVLTPGQVIQQEEDILIFQSVFYGDNKKYLLRVAAKRQADKWLILTAYRTSKVQKYWRDDF